MQNKDVQRLTLMVWLALVSTFLGLYFFKPELFHANNLKLLFSENLVESLLIYFLIGTLRGFTLVPLTPLLLAGALVLPAWPLYVVTLLCVLTSSSIAYYLGRYLGFDVYFNKKYPKQIAQLQQALKGKEIPVITLWGFFPVVPTDLICYVSEVMRIPLWKVLLGVIIGEAVICAVYIWGTDHLVGLILSGL
ncbi:MAG: TVP38/TMEM64 family protein [Proteobacteria bacterium]|nr:MAG: TVP38/TMEM64 family protein [Pseudomonadota bacterium]